MKMILCDTRILCDTHLKSEHNALHTTIKSIQKGRSLDNDYSKHNLEPRLLKQRHRELEKEMTLRGMRHTTPLDYFVLSFIDGMQRINKDEALRILLEKCVSCRDRYQRLTLNGKV